MGKVKVFNPIGESNITITDPAERLDTLSGKVIGFIDNMKPKADLFLKFIEELIKYDSDNVNIVRARKDPNPNLLIAFELEDKAQGVVNAWGD